MAPGSSLSLSAAHPFHLPGAATETPSVLHACCRSSSENPVRRPATTRSRKCSDRIVLGRILITAREFTECPTGVERAHETNPLVRDPN